MKLFLCSVSCKNYFEGEHNRRGWKAKFFGIDFFFFSHFRAAGNCCLNRLKQSILLSVDERLEDADKQSVRCCWNFIAESESLLMEIEWNVGWHHVEQVRCQMKKRRGKMEISFSDCVFHQKKSIWRRWARVVCKSGTIDALKKVSLKASTFCLPQKSR